MSDTPHDDELLDDPEAIEDEDPDYEDDPSVAGEGDEDVERLRGA